MATACANCHDTVLSTTSMHQANLCYFGLTTGTFRGASTLHVIPDSLTTLRSAYEFDRSESRCWSAGAPDHSLRQQSRGVVRRTTGRAGLSCRPLATRALLPDPAR